MADVIDAFVTFYESWREVGVGPDGLPLFEPAIKISLAKPPLLQVERAAEDEDREQFPEAWRAFEKQRMTRDTSVKGYPLAMWPVCSPADLRSCAARDIFTVEQLADLATRKGEDIPPPVLELAKRAKQMIALQKETGRFEALITDLTGQRDALAEQLKEANATISAQNALIGTLRAPPKVA